VLHCVFSARPCRAGVGERFLIDRLRAFYRCLPAIGVELIGGFRVVNNLVPQSNEPISVEHLPVGTYRAALEVGGRRLISDVFLVSR
jgi:hypothetical protein